MYLWAQMQDMPLSPGLHWQLLSNGFYQKKTLATDCSLSALQWLYYHQAKIQEAGFTHIIQHRYHQGEKTILGYKVDGYVEIGNRKIVYEYNGCKVSLSTCTEHVLVNMFY